MPGAARVGDPIAHSEAKSGGIWGAVKGALVGALIGAAVIGLTVVTGGAGLVLVGAYLVAGGTVLGMAGRGFQVGKAQGQQNLGAPCGKITRGSPTVFFDGLPAALACLSLATCDQHGGPPPPVALGSQTVLIHGHAAARVGDLGTACGYIICKGSETVFIGAPPASCHGLVPGREVPEWMDTAADWAIWVGDRMVWVGSAISLVGAARAMFAAGLTRAATAGITMTTARQGLLATQVGARLAVGTGVGYGLSVGGSRAGGYLAGKISNDPFVAMLGEGMGGVVAPFGAGAAASRLGAGRTGLPRLRPGEQRSWGVKDDMFALDIKDRIARPDGSYPINPRSQNMSNLGKPGQPGGEFVLNQQGRFQGKGSRNPMFVVDEQGSLIFGQRMRQVPGGEPVQRMPHPTLIGGQNPRVQAAGMARIENGRIVEVQYNNSGHFKPGPQSQAAAEAAFGRLRQNAPGVMGDNVPFVHVDVPPSPPPRFHVPVFPFAGQDQNP